MKASRSWISLTMSSGRGAGEGCRRRSPDSSREKLGLKLIVRALQRWYSGGNCELARKAALG